MVICPLSADTSEDETLLVGWLRARVYPYARVVPYVGARKAELMETPVMLVVTIVALRWVVLHFPIPSVTSARLGMGGIGLGLLLLAEFGFVLWVRGLSIRRYFSPRDRISGAVYYAALGLFAIMPLLVARS